MIFLSGGKYVPKRSSWNTADRSVGVASFRRERDWEENEKQNTLFTETRFLPAIMKEAGLVKSINEVRRNKPELCKELEGPDFIDLKWGKRHLFILVEGELPEMEE